MKRRKSVLYSISSIIWRIYKKVQAGKFEARRKEDKEAGVVR